MSLEKLVARCKDDPYNEVSAHLLPDGGGVEIMLSHRITTDAAVCIRIPSDADVRFLDDPKDAEGLDRTNEGGPW